MDVVARTLVDTAPGRDGLVRWRVEVPPGSWVEAAGGPGGELWYVLDGTGLLTSGDDPPAPIRRDTALWLPPGARYRLAIHLPPGQQHCLENTGPGTLWVLGVFHPGGSPAAKTSAS
jgi:mannose-6-phosphate isomerase-like protein (cupin superfamily)